MKKPSPIIVPCNIYEIIKERSFLYVYAILLCYASSNSVSN